jgi:hypothetical protein
MDQSMRRNQVHVRQKKKIENSPAYTFQISKKAGLRTSNGKPPVR